MTIEEAAKMLFVSRAHVLKLVDSGILVEASSRHAGGELAIDAASVDAYIKTRNARIQSYQATQNEDDDPVGL